MTKELEERPILVCHGLSKQTCQWMTHEEYLEDVKLSQKAGLCASLLILVAMFAGFFWGWIDEKRMDRKFRQW